MTSILRKKIASNTGLPPSLLEMRLFWSGLEKQCEVWARELFNADVTAKIITRKAKSNREVEDLLTSDVTFAFSEDASPGLLAIALDRDLALRYSAYRFKESAETFADVSSVFLRIACEQAACMLRKKIAEKVLNESINCEVKPIQGGSQDAIDLSSSGRCLVVTIELIIENKPTTINLVLSLEFALDFSRGALIRLASSREIKAGDCSDGLLQSVHKSEVKIEAVIDDITLSVGDWSRLEVGHIIELANADLTKLSIVTETIDGPLEIADAQMGVWKNQRALKLHGAVYESFIHNLAYR